MYRFIYFCKNDYLFFCSVSVDEEAAETSETEDQKVPRGKVVTSMNLAKLTKTRNDQQESVLLSYRHFDS